MAIHMKNSFPLAVIVRSRPSGKVIDYRGFLQAKREPGYLDQLAKNPDNRIEIVPDVFLCPELAPTRQLKGRKSQRLYSKPQAPTAYLEA